mmetsp:Transcript_39165/g.94696  ORF Transcript_39165/g.94696 Transcript_39165/m.94696 type:complete len:106 (-) Transcript_39165:1483-1800(-)
MPQSNPDAGDIKDLGRDGRLSFRNFAEHQLRKEFKADAMQKCDVQINAFASCAKEEGVMVVFRCNEFKRAVNECMAVYNSHERFEVYKREHMGDLENKVPGQIPR